MKKNHAVCVFYSLIALIIFSSCTNESKNIALSSDGVEIHFDVKGQGKPPIVLVHGFTNTKEFWDSQITYLSQNYQVISLDLAGFGESGNNRVDWTMESFGNDVVAVIEKLDLDQVVLVGFSMGGPVILESANKIPARIKGLVLVDVFHKVEYDYSQEGIARLVNSWKEIFGDKKRIPELFPAGTDSSIINRYISMTFSAPKVGWWESITDFFRWWGEDYQESLKSLKVPLMSINSDYETTDVEAYLKYVPSYKLKTISTIGHLVMWEAPDKFNSLLEECIQEFMNFSEVN